MKGKGAQSTDSNQKGRGGKLRKQNTARIRTHTMKRVIVQRENEITVKAIGRDQDD